MYRWDLQCRCGLTSKLVYYHRLVYFMTCGDYESRQGGRGTGGRLPSDVFVAVS